jgi:hypothetical protein
MLPERGITPVHPQADKVDRRLLPRVENPPRKCPRLQASTGAANQDHKNKQVRGDQDKRKPSEFPLRRNGIYQGNMERDAANAHE